MAERDWDKVQAPRDTDKFDPIDGLLMIGEAMARGVDSAVEEELRNGQRDMCYSEAIPKKVRGFHGSWDDLSVQAAEGLTKLGFILGPESDRLFCRAIWPKGWRKEATDHSMWSRVLDEKGRERATIFYKSAFWDREAFMNVHVRFEVRVERDPYGVPFAVYILDRATDQKLLVRTPTRLEDRDEIDALYKSHKVLLSSIPGTDDPTLFWDDMELPEALK